MDGVQKGTVTAGFQSTLPMRGATFSMVLLYSDIANFNPHSPCGERPNGGVLGKATEIFQSTLPMRGATLDRLPDLVFVAISIHTPHAGSDASTCCTFQTAGYFNPHSPCGERHELVNDQRQAAQFQSTLPMRGATAASWGRLGEGMISIHTPHAGSDACCAPISVHRL